MRVLVSRLSCFFVAVAAFAQTPSASVVGRITDPSGAVVPGVTVKVTELDTGIIREGLSNDIGEYTIPYLNPGRYSLEASAPGFRTYRREELTLAVDQILRIDIGLEVGATTETIVVAEAPPTLNTETGARGEVTTADEISELPLEGRNFTDLALLTVGVIPKGDGGDGTYAVNGARADDTGFVLDGVNNTQRRNTGSMVQPPIESVQEFKMLTSGFSAEYGRYAGGQLTAVTKSGTNRLRGTLSEFVRNDALDAMGYFDVEKSKLRRHQFGATLGGPVYFPRLYNGRNRTFFFFSWESLRLIQGKSKRELVPPPEMFQGDFSRAVDAFGRPVAIRDALTGQPFPGNQIPASRLNPVALKLSRYYPQPNYAGGVFNYIAQGNATNDNDNFSVKVDHNLSLRDRLTSSVFWRQANNWDPVMTSRSPIPFFGSTNRTPGVLAYIRYLRSLTPGMYLEAGVSFSRRTNRQVWPYSADKDWAAETGFIGGTKNPVAAGPPYVQITSYMILGPAYDIPKIWAYNNYQYTATAAWIRGRHNTRFGFDYLRAQYFSRNYGDTRGRISFDGSFTRFSVADFMLGWIRSSRRQLDAAGPYHFLGTYAAFFQDDLKLRPSLTLNLGLRYELMKPPREKFGAWAMFLPPLEKVVVAGTGTLSESEFNERIAAVRLSNYVVKASAVGLPPTITKTDRTNFGPRFGFAWRMFGNTRTVLRGGYGIFYGTFSLYRMDEYADTFPFSITETFSRLSSNPNILTLSDPFPISRRGFSGVTSSYGQETAEPQTQYLQAYNLTLEREVGGFVIEMAYAGSKGTHLPRRYDINQAGRTYETRSLRPYPFFGTINIINDGSTSFYSSGQFTIRRRFSERLFVRASYTYAKSLDESSNVGGTIQYNFPMAQDARNLRLERGRSDFDVGHAFAASFIWSPRISRHPILRNWQVAGTSTLYTGPPFTVRVANVDYSAGEATRPDRIRKGTLPHPTPDMWFDRDAFPPVPTGSYRFGNSGRNILDGPGSVIINTSLSRRFRIQEKCTLQFRAEAFNLPNHPNFYHPENNVNVISGGVISRAKNNRNLQLALRLEY